MRIADILTALRVILTPVVMWLVFSDQAVAAVCVFAAGSMTDVLDGYSARRSGAATAYGPTFDALADFTLVYGTTLALAIRGEAFWLLVVALASIAYLIPVIGIISKKVGGLTVPHLDTALLAVSVHSTIMAHIVGWRYAEVLLAIAFFVAIFYAAKYIAFARSIPTG
jgi:phosphatidylglycerophosphate synthase